MKLDFLEKLNEKQKEAVYATNSKICVVAGPGCGKTKTLVSRIIYLLINENKPNNLLILTFSKKAIKEVKKRILSQIKIKDLQIFNFHSFCFKILNKYSYLLGFINNKFNVYDRIEQEIIIKKILEKKEIIYDKKEINSIITLINNFKNGKLKSIKELNDLDKPKYEIYQEYQRYLKINKSLDYNDLIIYTIFLLENYNFVCKEYQNQFTNILLDEFQDTNNNQWKLIELINTSKQKIFLVGDPNQLIYSFQGSTPQLFSSIIKNKNWKIIFLNINYRSTNNIIELANSFIKNNKNFLIQNLLTSGNNYKENIKTNLINYWTPYTLVNYINWLLNEEKVKLNEIAILYRNNYLVEKIEYLLIEKKIPYEILGSYKFIEREEIKDIIAICRSIIYKDNISLLRVLNLQKNIGAKTIEKIEKESLDKNVSIYEFLININQNKDKKIISKLENINWIILKINNWENQLLNNISLSIFLSNILINFYQEILDNKNNFEKQKNVKQFINIASNWEKKQENKDNNKELLNNFLQWLIISYEDRKMLKNHNNLILSSIHQAKGLEFETVFFIYLDEGILPYRENQNLAEEKRLFYTGITRAKKMLYLVSNKKNHSSFLKEIDNNFFINK